MPFDIILVSGGEKRLTIFQHSVSADSNTSKVNTMAIDVVTVVLLKATPLLESTIDSLMALSSPFLSTLIS